MPTTSNGNTPIANPMLIDRRELLRSSQRGTTNNGSSAFSDALGALGTVAEGIAPLSGKSVVQAALTTGGQMLNSGSEVSAQGVGGARILSQTGRIQDPPAIPGRPGTSTDYNSQLNDFSNQQMQMTMLLQKTQGETMKWNLITNIMKEKHDTSMNAVRNMKS